MLIVQKFHSIHEIDPEFITSLEVLLKEEIPHFDYLKNRQDSAPADDFFTYFLFFGPTQNTPIGFAQLVLRKIPYEGLIPWWRKFIFWKRDYLQWKQAIWKMIDGDTGLCIFNSKYSRSGQEKMLKIIQEYSIREDVKAEVIYSPLDAAEFQNLPSQKKCRMHVLDALVKNHNDYQTYLSSLDKNLASSIKKKWKALHNSGISLGEHADLSLLKGHDLPEAAFKQLSSWKPELLTFQKEGELIGCLIVIKGKEGHVFVEPLPLRNSFVPEIEEELYIHYAIIKFHEMTDFRRLHILRYGKAITATDESELASFKSLGFATRTVEERFHSKLPKLTAAV